MQMMTEKEHINAINRNHLTGIKMSLKQTALAYLKKNKIKKDILRLTAKYLFYKI